MKFTGKWMELEKIILHEVSQTQKNKYCTCLLMWVLAVESMITIACEYMSWLPGHTDILPLSDPLD